MSKISIITVNLNNSSGLLSTINSVSDQNYTDKQFIVIDGASTDDSTDVLNQYHSKIDIWISEPDKGIYNAMNKGAASATGEYLFFLNSGDVFESSDILSEVSSQLSADIVCGNIRLQGSSSREIKYAPQKISLEYLLKDTLPHQSMFIKKAVFNNLGGYDERIKMVSDWAFLMKAFFRFRCSYQHLNKTISIFDMDGVSSKNENQATLLSERTNFIDREFSYEFELYQSLQNMRKKYDSIVYRFPFKQYLATKRWLANFFPF